MATSFGRGAMTNHWIDIKNSDVILIMGSNAAENHPISFRWVTEARVAGAKLISVDPRFTRTSSKADIYAPLRSGTDIAFLGGMLKYILDNGLIHEESVKEYTNASFLVDEGYEFDTVTGLFSGYDATTKKYDRESATTTWRFQTDGDGVILRDKTLANPRCVYQILKAHYSRYDLDTVSAITGTPKDKLQEVYETYVGSSYQSGKAGTIMYAMGWTQHTVGAQNIRAMAMIQLLLGNIGVAGGGVNALRGESNVQGSTDHCLLYHILPGYLQSPEDAYPTLDDYITKWTPTTNEPRSANWWGNYRKYMVSYLKSMYGAAATAANNFAYEWLPKRDKGVPYAWQCMFDAMYRQAAGQELKGFFAWGQNPANSSANANKVRQALAKLDWMVCVNIYPTETAEFWRGPGMDPANVQTEVFQLPCAASIEKEGSITNSGRWAQWRYKAIDPPGEAKPDAEIMNEIFAAVKALYEAEGTGAVFPDPILNVKWDYFDDPDKISDAIAKEINGYFLVDSGDYQAGDLVPNFVSLADDGTTSSGNWLYCDSYTKEEGNLMARRTRSDAATDVIGLNPEWAWCWPLNRRIVYNRASVDLFGQPYDSEHPVITWDGEGWVGDVPDGGWPPLKNPDGIDNPDSRLPYIMEPNGVGRVFGVNKMADGPIPEHYEPLESPLASNPMGHGQRLNPTALLCDSDLDLVAPPADATYPIVCSTYRMVEHWQTGVMTRWTPWLNELQPEMFVEMSEELAAEKGIASGERVRVRSIRGEVQAVAIVTKRFKPFTIMGETVHQVGVPWCFGWYAPNPDNTRVTNGNLLTPNVGDPNTRIPESKAFMVDVVKEA
ncbi:MAG: formate dehydrogenase-N subunit alpha [Phycisphaerales bacterium]|nr:MAG: formate dehydrogenase-N subunit alpha [Phycisphaerales bacterium]